MLWIEPSAVCNLHCPGCPTASGQERGGVMSLDRFERILGMLPKTVRLLNLWHRGEPLAAPEFPEMVAAAAKKGIRVQTYTNGVLLTRNNIAHRLVKASLTGISIAVDGPDEETYQRYRPGGTLADLAAGVKALAEAKRELKTRRPRIIIECLVSRQTTAQFAQVKRLALEWGADEVLFKTLRVGDLNYSDSRDELPDDRRLWRYEIADGGLKMKRKRESCLRLGYSFVVAWNGDIYPCCFYLKSFAPFGNIFESGFSDVWRKGALSEFRKVVAEDRDRIPMCRNCTEGLTRLYVDPIRKGF